MVPMFKNREPAPWSILVWNHSNMGLKPEIMRTCGNKLVNHVRFPLAPCLKANFAALGVPVSSRCLSWETNKVEIQLMQFLSQVVLKLGLCFLAANTLTLRRMPRQMLHPARLMWQALTNSNS